MSFLRERFFIPQDWKRTAEADTELPWHLDGGKGPGLRDAAWRGRMVPLGSSEEPDENDPQWIDNGVSEAALCFNGRSFVRFPRFGRAAYRLTGLDEITVEDWVRLPADATRPGTLFPLARTTTYGPFCTPLVDLGRVPPLPEVWVLPGLSVDSGEWTGYPTSCLSNGWWGLARRHRRFPSPLSSQAPPPIVQARGAKTKSLSSSPTPRGASQVKVHCVVDISHEFTFYFDGRFATNYVTPSGGVGVQNWATLHKCGLSNANLLVLQSGATPCPYLPEDIGAVLRFLKAGGGVCVLGDYALFRHEKEYRLNELTKAFGAKFVAQPAKQPLRASPKLKAQEVRTYGGRTLRLQTPGEWQILILDAARRPVMVRRTVGKGQLLLASRALAGHQPDAKDPINAQWWQPLLADLAKGKTVDPARQPQGMSAENKTEKEGLAIQCTDYLQPLADQIFALYAQCRPAMERLLGVPPAKDMLTTLILLPTSGGGFSSGQAVALGVWWGDFPAKKYGMVELLGHESTHSWVLPFPEPMWNEGIATYVGIRLGRELGYKAEADAALKGWINAARRDDPSMEKLDLAAAKGVPDDVELNRFAVAFLPHVFPPLSASFPARLSDRFTSLRAVTRGAGV